MQIPLENRLGFYINIDQGPQTGQCIAGGWLAMNHPLPGKDRNEWQNLIETTPPLFGAYVLCGSRQQQLIRSCGSVFEVLKIVAESFYSTAKCSKLRVRLVNHKDEGCICIVVEQTTFGVSHYLN